MMLKWILRTMYMSQVFILCIFSLRTYIAGMASMVILLASTYQFGGYMRRKEEELLQLPMEVAIKLDEEGAMERKPTFLYHLPEQSQAKKRGDYIQPCLEEKPIHQPKSSDDLGKFGAWSSDPLCGGLCRYPVLLCSNAVAYFTSRRNIYSLRQAATTTSPHSPEL